MANWCYFMCSLKLSEGEAFVYTCWFRRLVSRVMSGALTKPPASRI
jgi:hypothetical protein